MSQLVIKGIHFGRLRYEWQCIGRMKMINRSISMAQICCRFDTCLNIPTRQSDSLNHIYAIGEVRRNGSFCVLEMLVYGRGWTHKPKSNQFHVYSWIFGS